MDIDDETTKQLSNNQKHQLINKISQLISKLQHLIQILEKQVENNNKTL
jgi:phenylpyruvate tautomerase PptA (4-oxalocrotonate tautomerase family)